MNLGISISLLAPLFTLTVAEEQRKPDIREQQPLCNEFYPDNIKNQFQPLHPYFQSSEGERK